MLESMLDPDKWDPQKVSAVADTMTAIATMAAVAVAGTQLRNGNKQKRVWSTLQACDRYDSDPTVSEAARVFFNFCEGRDLTVDVVKLENSTRTLFNYFEAIAIGMYQELYEPEIVYEHLGTIMITRRKQLFQSQSEIHKKYAENFTDYFAEFNRICDRFSRGKTRLKFLGVRLQGID